MGRRCVVVRPLGGYWHRAQERRTSGRARRSACATAEARDGSAIIPPPVERCGACGGRGVPTDMEERAKRAGHRRLGVQCMKDRRGPVD